ncbi:DUF1540 domain-containing protein [Arthrobacter alpinus]|nr:DUF1540 domain-containing protein [Arthrobacter alpinus]
MAVTVPVAECAVANCSFNDHTHCGASSVRVGPGADNADCLTYEHSS